MREYEFRGKVRVGSEVLDDLNIPHDGRWVYGNLMNNGNLPYITGSVYEREDGLLVPEWWVGVIPETVGEYTGMKLPDGRKIYEGDLLTRAVKLGLYGTEAIRWVSQTFKVEWKYGGWHVAEDRLEFALEETVTRGGFEVTEFSYAGSIHDDI